LPTYIQDISPTNLHNFHKHLFYNKGE